MESAEHLAQRFREVFLDGKWVANTNLLDQLKEVPLSVALSEVSDLNTLAKLAFHLNYYLGGVLNVFKGGALEIHDKFSFDLPEMKTEADWEALKADLFANAGKFADHVALLTEEQLESVFVDDRYGSYRRNIEGMIEHGYYHLRQVVLLKKLINSTQD